MIEGPRAAKIEELPQIVKLTSWIFGFEKHGVYLDKVFPHVFCEKNIENLRVIVSDGRVVSHLGIWEGWLNFYGFWLKVGLIGCVCTHPEHRMKGYASALVKDAFIKLSSDRVDLVMISGARSLYTRAGCVEAGIIYDYHVPLDVIKDLATRLDGLKIEPYTEDRISDLIGLYQSEPIRFKRSFEEFKLLAGRTFVAEVSESMSIFIAYRMGKSVSYVVFVKGVWNNLTIVEYAGSRVAALKTIYEASKIFNVEHVKLPVPYGDWELTTLLEEYGLKPKSSHATASLAILNPVVFTEKIRPYVEERLGVKANFSIAACNDNVFESSMFGERVKFEDSRAFTMLVFGRPETVHSSDTVKFDSSRIPEVFKRVFPMPSFNYGLNFI
ncbi:GNAT family N-acetyltransferase [Candidatus Bathyarchaeota archaeon]|nr:GNAT family N-acetyltransferase [Candidatus Bathyarchaeota archaeon]